MLPHGLGVLAFCLSLVAAPPSYSSGPSGLPEDATGRAIRECRQQQERVYRTVDDVLLALEAAQRSGDPGQMRSAIDSSQTTLADLKRSNALCSNLLDNVMHLLQKASPPAH